MQHRALAALRRVLVGLLLLGGNGARCEIGRCLDMCCEGRGGEPLTPVSRAIPRCAELADWLGAR